MPYDDAESSWELGSGFALDGARVTITDCEFGFNNNLGAGIPCANMTFTGEDGTPMEQSFSAGNNFMAASDGSELQPVNEGTEPKVNKNTRYGVLIASAINVVENPADEIGDVRVAKSWLGTEWTMGTISRPTKNPTTGVEKNSDFFIFTEYHGRGDAEPDEPVAAPRKAAAKTTAATKKATAPGRVAGKAKAGSTLESTNPDLWAELLALANESEDHDAFVEAAMDREDVETDKLAQKAVYSSGKDSVWAARG